MKRTSHEPSLFYLSSLNSILKTHPRSIIIFLSVLFVYLSMIFKSKVVWTDKITVHINSSDWTIENTIFVKQCFGIVDKREIRSLACQCIIFLWWNFGKKTGKRSFFYLSFKFPNEKSFLQANIVCVCDFIVATNFGEWKKYDEPNSHRVLFYEKAQK